MVKEEVCEEELKRQKIQNIIEEINQLAKEYDIFYKSGLFSTSYEKVSLLFIAEGDIVVLENPRYICHDVIWIDLENRTIKVNDKTWYLPALKFAEKNKYKKLYKCWRGAK